MTNHFHFLIKQNGNNNIDKLILSLGTSYAKYFNKKYARVGNLFQDRFKSKLVDDDDYLIHLSAYIHNNPNSPLTYEYSSFKNYVGQRDDGLIDKKYILDYFGRSAEKYKEFVLDNFEYKQEKISHLIFEE